MKKCFPAVTGILTGFINGLFGAGGGIIAIPLLKRCGLSQKECHATSLAVTMPLSVLSAFLYLRFAETEFKYALMFIPGGIFGALLGAFIMKKISPTALKRIFGAVVIFAAVKGLL